MVESGEGTRLLVDTSPDMRSQLLACRVPGVDAILYTHAHADHITGLDDVRILNRIADRPLEAFGTRATLDELIRRFGYAFRPWQPPGFFRPVLAERAVTPGETVAAAGMAMRVFDQDHGFTRSLGLRIGGFGYSTDVVGLDDAAFEALVGVDTWVVGLLSAAWDAQDARQSGGGAGVGAARGRAADGADAYGHRYGLGLAGGEPAGGC